MRKLPNTPGLRVVASRPHGGGVGAGDSPAFATQGWRSGAGVFFLAYAALVLSHAPLLSLPYFWDEAGYYIPAARDILVSHSLVPHTTLSNAHPPLVPAYLAAWWRIAAFAPLVTRAAMLGWAAAALAGLYRLACRVANRDVALAAVICTALFPVFFVQSSLAHLDMAAAALTMWALAMYVEGHIARSAACFALAALAKETALVTPLALLVWEVACPFIHSGRWCLRRPSLRRATALLLPALPLAMWFAYHRARTGYVFGNPEFFRYNVAATIVPVRVALALVQRLGHMVLHMNMYVLTLATVAAMFWPALPESDASTAERERIAVPVQLVFGVVIVAQIVAMSVLGGALLTRYLLPAYPLFVLICVATLWRRISFWKAVVAIVCAGFLVALFVDPPYRSAPEDNLTYADFIRLHQTAAEAIATQYPSARVLTAWPATDEVARPWLGYVQRPQRVVAIENFTREQLAQVDPNSFDVALVFSTKLEPPGGSLLHAWHAWMRLQQRYFDYHEDLDAESAATLLGGRLQWKLQQGRESVALIVKPGLDASRMLQ